MRTYIVDACEQPSSQRRDETLVERAAVVTSAVDVDLAVLSKTDQRVNVDDHRAVQEDVHQRTAWTRHAMTSRCDPERHESIKRKEEL